MKNRRLLNFQVLLMGMAMLFFESCSMNKRVISLIEREYNVPFAVFSDTATSLSLREKKLRTIPEAVFQCRNLQSLDLSMNKIKKISGSIEQLANLEYLTMAYSKVTALPNSIGKLKKLKYLNLLDNQLRSVPSEIGNLENLRVLNLNANPIKSLPNSIFHMNQLQILNVGQWKGDTLLERSQIDSLIKSMPDCKVSF